MKTGMPETENAVDRVLIASLIVPAVLLPGDAIALQVGCFVTAVFLGIMFIVGLGITVVVKHALVRYVGKASKTPWLRMFGITWLELLLGIVVFAAVRTSFWITALIYLPFAALLNRALLGRRLPSVGEAPFVQRFGIFLLLSAALPVSIQFAGALWSAVTNLITFTDLQM